MTTEEMQKVLRLLKHCPYRNDSNVCKMMCRSCHDVLKKEQCIRLVEVSEVQDEDSD